MEKSSQNSWGGKGPLDIIWSNCSAQAVPPLAEPCGDGFWVSPRTETLSSPWAGPISAQSPSQPKKYFLMFRRNLQCFSLCLLLPVIVQYTNSKDMSSTGKWWKKKEVQSRLEKNWENFWLSLVYCADEWNQNDKSTRIINEVVR